MITEKLNGILNTVIELTKKINDLEKENQELRAENKKLIQQLDKKKIVYEPNTTRKMDWMDI